jgi:hypothetical protein
VHVIAVKMKRNATNELARIIAIRAILLIPEPHASF